VRSSRPCSPPPRPTDHVRLIPLPSYGRCPSNDEAEAAFDAADEFCVQATLLDSERETRNAQRDIALELAKRERASNGNSTVPPKRRRVVAQ